MKRTLTILSILFYTAVFSQGWIGKTPSRIDSTGASFKFTFTDNSTAFVQKDNIVYIVNASPYVQMGFITDGSTARIISFKYSVLTYPVASSASNLSDTLNSWLTNPSGGSSSYTFTNALTNTLGTVKLGGTQVENTTISGASHKLTFSGQSQLIIDPQSQDDGTDQAKVMVLGGSAVDTVKGVKIFGAHAGTGIGLDASGYSAHGIGAVFNGIASDLEGTVETGISTDSTGISKTGISENGKGFSLNGTSTNSFGGVIEGTGKTVGLRGVGTGDSVGVELHGTSVPGDGLGLEGWSTNHFGASLFGNSVNSTANYIGGISTNGSDLTLDPRNGKFQIQHLITDNSKAYLLGIDSATGNVRRVLKSTIGGGSSETVVELGTIDYTDINAAAADPNILLNLTTNQFPANSYPVLYKIVVTSTFESETAPDVFLDYLDQTIVFSSYPGTPLPQLSSTATYLITNLLWANGYYQPNGVGTTAQIGLQFGGTNPKDFTGGSLTVYAVVKPVP